MDNTVLTYIDIYPDQAQYKTAQSGSIVVEVETREETVLKLVVGFHKLEQQVAEERLSIRTEPGLRQRVPVPLFTEATEWAGYGVKATVLFNEAVVTTAYTSYDIADHWSRAPRYGFLSDFRSEESGDTRDVDSMNKFHLNVIQFYDWMYRHDDLVPKEDEFIDPMGRTMSYKVVREKVAAVHDKGMAAMAYGAVYAGLKDFLQARPEWGLYNRQGDPFQLIDLFYIMDITPDSPWTDHIVEQFRQAVQAGFDGIHMDQYGFPKKAVRRIGGKKSWSIWRNVIRH